MRKVTVINDDWFFTKEKQDNFPFDRGGDWERISLPHTQNALDGQDGVNAAVGSLRAYFKEGGFAVHYNVLSAKALREAKESPEKYPNLQVRKCGWNVRFSSLTEIEQNELIARAER